MVRGDEAYYRLDLRDSPDPGGLISTNNVKVGESFVLMFDVPVNGVRQVSLIYTPPKTQEEEDG